MAVIERVAAYQGWLLRGVPLYCLSSLSGHYIGPISAILSEKGSGNVVVVHVWFVTMISDAASTTWLTTNA